MKTNDLQTRRSKYVNRQAMTHFLDKYTAAEKCLHKLRTLNMQCNNQSFYLVESRMSASLGGCNKKIPYWISPHMKATTCIKNAISSKKKLVVWRVYTMVKGSTSSFKAYKCPVKYAYTSRLGNHIYHQTSHIIIMYHIVCNWLVDDKKQLKK